MVSIEGRAKRIDDDRDHVTATGRAYQAKYAAEEGFDDVDGVIEFLGQNAAYEITPERAFGMIETPEEFGPCATKWTWD